MIDIFLQPEVTEKSVRLSDQNQYVFKVNQEATKSEIKKAIEKIFKVKIIAVNTTYRQTKRKRSKGIVGETVRYKKAIVTLKKGDKIKELEVK